MAAWSEPRRRLDRDALNALIDGDLAVVRIEGFATPDECATACRAIRDPSLGRRAATTSPMDLIGSNFSNHAGPRKADYFDTVPGAFQDQQAVFAGAFDVMGRIFALLSGAWDNDVDYACEPEPYGRYFAGGIKTRVQPSHLHFDYVPHFSPEYAIGQVVDQLSWNLYLEMPDGTGETTLYHSPVSRHTRPPTTGTSYTSLPESFVEGAESYSFRASVGELVLFNTRNPHRISVEDVQPGQSRIQVGSFIGRTTDDRLVMWS